jgi:magnesium-transporting ATPase (P-type)
LKVSVLDRLGGSKITNIAKNTEDEYKELCQAIENYNYKKLKFLNKAHREVEVADDTGKVTIEEARNTLGA